MKGRWNWEGGMRPEWGAHHRSAPHHMGGMMSVRPNTLATAKATLIYTCTPCVSLPEEGLPRPVCSVVIAKRAFQKV